MKERKKLIEFPVLGGYQVHVIVSDDIIGSRLIRSDKFGPLEPGSFKALHSHVPGACVSYLFIRKDASAGTIAHEAWHCIWHIWDWIGADFENETVAYHIGYLVDEVTNFKNEK